MTLSKVEHSVATTTEAISLFASEEVEFLREQVNSLHHMVEQLNLELLDKQQQIQDLEQELMQTNRELCNALSVKETRESQQIECQELSASKPLDELIEAIDEPMFLTNEPERTETHVKINTPLNVMAERTFKTSKESIARSQQLQAQSNELGIQFVSLRANYTRFSERTTEVVTQLPQQDENISLFFLKDNCQKNQENLKQLKAHRLRSKELLKDSRASVEQTKLELLKLQKYHKNLEQVDFCEAKIDLSNPA